MESHIDTRLDAPAGVSAPGRLWTRAGHIKVNPQKGIDIRKLDRLIAQAVLGDLRS